MVIYFCVRGIENDKQVDELMNQFFISRVLSANKEWNTILHCAQNPEMTIIISNTTEVGISLSNDDIQTMIPLLLSREIAGFFI
jgi:tagaturonate reductase